MNVFLWGPDTPVHCAGHTSQARGPRVNIHTQSAFRDRDSLLAVKNKLKDLMESPYLQEVSRTSTIGSPLGLPFKDDTGAKHSRSVHEAVT